MEIRKQIEFIIDKRKVLDVNDDYGAENCRKEEIVIFNRNLNDTIKCLNEISSEYYYWVCEVFEDISEHFNSKELIECMKRNAKRTCVDCEVDIEYAIKALK